MSIIYHYQNFATKILPIDEKISPFISRIVIIPLTSDGFMDVAGVALATVISQCLSAILIIRCLMQEEGSLHLDIKLIRLNRAIFLQILRIGLPAGIQGILFSFSNVIVQSAVNGFGSTVVAGNSASANLELFVYFAMAMLGIPLSELDLPSGVLIAVIHRGKDLIIPNGNTKIELNDKVIILSLLSEIGDLEKLLKSKV